MTRTCPLSFAWTQSILALSDWDPRQNAPAVPNMVQPLTNDACSYQTPQSHDYDVLFILTCSVHSYDYFNAMLLLHAIS